RDGAGLAPAAMYGVASWGRNSHTATAFLATSALSVTFCRWPVSSSRADRCDREGEVSDHGPRTESCRPQSRVHDCGTGARGRLAAVVDLDARRARCPAGCVGGDRGDRGRGRTVRVVCLELRGGGTRHPRPVGCALARGCGRALPLGAQPDLHRRTPGCAGGGMAVPIAAAAGLRGHHGGPLPGGRPRPRGTGAFSPLW